MIRRKMLEPVPPLQNAAAEKQMQIHRLKTTKRSRFDLTQSLPLEQKSMKHLMT